MLGIRLAHLLSDIRLHRLIHLCDELPQSAIGQGASGSSAATYVDAARFLFLGLGFGAHTAFLTILHHGSDLTVSSERLCKPRGLTSRASCFANVRTASRLRSVADMLKRVRGVLVGERGKDWAVL